MCVVFRLVLVVYTAVQAEQLYSIKLPVNRDPVAESVSVIHGSPTLYCVHYSDGGISDPLPLAQLRGRARELAQVHEPKLDVSIEEQLPSGRRRMRARQPQTADAELAGKRRRKRAFSKMKDDRSASRDTLRKWKQRRVLVDDVSLDKPAVSEEIKMRVPQLLRSFGVANDAARLQESIDSDWQRDLDENASNIAAFPDIPSEDRTLYSLQRWRESMSSPAIDLAVCAVCAQRLPAALVKAFAVSDDCKSEAPMIGAKLLAFMQTRMQHNVGMPSHLSADLPDGMHPFDSCDLTVAI